MIAAAELSGKAKLLDNRSLRERQREARGESILKAAFALIVEEGYDALTMEGLAARVGISRQTLYHHFKSREEITLRAILSLLNQGIAVIEAADPESSPSDRLKLVVRWMFESRAQPWCAALVKVRHSIMTVKSHPDYKAAFERRAAALAKIVSSGQAAGEIRADVPSRLIVQMLLGLVSDASYEGLVSAGQTNFPQVCDAIIDVFFTGLRP